jgi:long-chain fatty acid transport protein
MKKILCALLPLLLIVSAATVADDNQSAAWVRTLCREAVTDSIDAAYFNPAGTAFLDKGLYVQAMNLSVIQEYSHFSVLSSTTYAANTPVWFFPTARIGYNGGSWAAFFDFNIPAGGGSLDYKDGSVLLDAAGATGSTKGSSAVLAFNVGASYRFGDMISVGASGRILYANDGIDVTITAPAPVAGSAEAKATGIGFGGMFGVNVIPLDGLTLAVTVETGSKLELEYTEVTGDPGTVAALAAAPLFVAEGNTYDSDLPWRVRTGIAYELPFGLSVSGTFKYDFYESLDSALRNTYTIAGSVAYDITEKIEASLGGSYGIDEVPAVDDYNPLNPELSSITLAGGVGVEVIRGLTIDFGTLYVFYQGESGTGASGFTDLDKDTLLFSVGATYSF